MAARERVVVVNHNYGKNATKGVAFLLWLILGGIGAHRFYTGNILVGLAYLLSAVLCFTVIWIPVHFVVWLFDGFLILIGSDKYYRANKR